MSTPLYQTKSFWSGITATITGIGMIIMGDVATGIQTIIGGVMIICVRDAITTSTK